MGDTPCGGRRASVRDVRLRSGVISRDLKGEEIVLDLESGEYFSLDEVGSRIWSGLCRGLSEDEIVAEVVREWEVESAVARHDVDRLVDELVARGLLDEGARG